MEAGPGPGGAELSVGKAPGEAWHLVLAGTKWGFLLTWAGILGMSVSFSSAQGDLARPAEQDPSRIGPPECISVIRLSKELMHFLAASIKLNQVLMRLLFFGLVFLDELSWGDSVSQEPGKVPGHGTGAGGGRDKGS